MARDEERVREWLDADRRDADEEADAAFAQLFAAVPRLDAPPTFARRVARRARRAAVAARRRTWTRGRVGASAGLGALALAALFVAITSLASFLVTRLPQLVTMAAQAFIWLMVAIDNGLGLWGVVVRVARALGSAVATPQMTVGLIVIEVVGGAALFALYRLLASEQESDRGESLQILRRP